MGDISSALVLEHDEPLYFTPNADGKRRGSALLEARLPIFGVSKPGAGCASRWLLVGPEAWLCEQRVSLRSWPATELGTQTAHVDGLPYRYHFVSADGSFGYASLRLAEEGIPDSQLEPGFAVAIVRTEFKPGGDLFGLSTHDLWIPMRDLRPARASSFRGVQLTRGELNVAWVVRDQALVYRQPGQRGKERLGRLTQVTVLDRVRHRGREYLRFADGRYLLARDVRQPVKAPVLPEIRTGERWLDIDDERQTLVAYQGATPIFATLVSTGKGRGTSQLATPKGAHRIWVKLVSTDMTNLEQVDARRYYAIEDVPWVMFFKRGYGLHGAFWHRSFGQRRSHGCVNLSPPDAHFLFQWTGPTLPAGWHAALPTEHDQGTLVVVR